MHIGQENHKILNNLFSLMLHLAKNAVQKQAVLHQPVTTNKLIKTKQINFAHDPFRVQQQISAVTQKLFITYAWGRIITYEACEIHKSNSLYSKQISLLFELYNNKLRAITFNIMCNE